jgi:8-oxo-dGTP diphosphatase
MRLARTSAQGGARRPPDAPHITVTYFGLVPDVGARRNATWASLTELPILIPRQREAVDAALAAMRARVDQQPIAFRLLPPAFTLSELQAVYELLLGRQLHKASFRRALHAAALVEATDEWRSEGRGRPAQLFRYSPPRRRKQRRGIRFDLLS